MTCQRHTDQPGFLRELALYEVKVSHKILPNAEERRAHEALVRMGEHLLRELYPSLAREEAAVAKAKRLSKNCVAGDDDVSKEYPETIERSEVEKNLDNFISPLSCG